MSVVFIVSLSLLALGVLVGVILGVMGQAKGRRSLSVLGLICVCVCMLLLIIVALVQGFSKVDVPSVEDRPIDTPTGSVPEIYDNSVGNEP